MFKRVLWRGAQVTGCLVVAGVGGALAFQSYSTSQVQKRLATTPPNHPVLLSFPSTPTTSPIGFSPFCVKILILLRMLDIDHTVIETLNSCQSETQRLPCLELNGKSTPDSEDIIDVILTAFPEHIAAAKTSQQKTAFLTKDQLTDEEDLDGLLMSRLVENSTRLAIYRHSFVNHPSETIAPHFTGMTGFPFWAVDCFVCNAARGEMIKLLNAHGQGDLTEDRFYEEFLKDIKAIERQLVKVNGDHPEKSAAAKGGGGIATSRGFTRYDLAVFGMLNFARDVSSAKCDATNLVMESPVIQSYMARIEEAARYSTSTDKQRALAAA